MGKLWHACVPVHAPAGAGKNVKPRRLFARGSQVGVELYRTCTLYAHMYVLELSNYHDNINCLTI